VRVETPEGRAQYAAEQRGFTARTNALRRRLLRVLRPVLAAAGPDGPGGS
jgi:hypothetical protein